MVYLHITLEERKLIEQKLQQPLSLNRIAEDLQRHPNSIRKEIQRNRILHTSPYQKTYRTPNDCSHRRTCQVTRLCSDCDGPMDHCSFCEKCNSVCTQFQAVHCPQRDASPWCCNGCKQKNACPLHKYYYRANAAHRKALQRLSSSRASLACSEAEIHDLSLLFSPLLQNGHSVHSIYVNHIEEMPCSEKTIYRYIDQRLFEATNLDLPLKVRRKPTRRRGKHHVLDKTCRNGRLYEDFLQWKFDNPGVNEVQIDTLEGQQGSRKVLLTMHWLRAGFMKAYLLERKTAAQVNQVFAHLHKQLGKERFQHLFPAILTDRGTEFSWPDGIESYQGHKWVSLYYCDANQSQQKAQVENEHRMIRKILPKGHSFDHLNQEDIDRMMSHITSYVRLARQDRTPQAVFEFLYGESVEKVFGLARIEPDRILLKPRLLHWPKETTTDLQKEENQ